MLLLLHSSWEATPGQGSAVLSPPLALTLPAEPAAFQAQALPAQRSVCRRQQVQPQMCPAVLAALCNCLALYMQGTGQFLHGTDLLTSLLSRLGGEGTERAMQGTCYGHVQYRGGASMQAASVPARAMLPIT